MSLRHLQRTELDGIYETVPSRLWVLLSPSQLFIGAIRGVDSRLRRHWCQLEPIHRRVNLPNEQIEGLRSDKQARKFTTGS
jgi:hypothetical protein